MRCAIYTRKSSEEGLEQDFNSLQAQREACEAYIASQKHEGWIVLSTCYDDGGVSGATLERPALQRLLADVEAGRIDTIVVYKVDRLTRTLSDFSRLVEIFDRKDVSFVSVTQQFNTTTSMGRLTLNVLLSFAQFEREVTGERIRDKIAASKRKGMWMGGNPPLGYDVKDKKLIVNKAEAETVRSIFRQYREIESVRELRDRLAAEGVTSKRRRMRDGRVIGGKPINRGALYHLLHNRLYRGEMVHKDKAYPGQHEAIVDEALWDEVQATLAANTNGERREGTRQPSLLTGLVVDEQGEGLSPSHAVKKGRRYRYYVLPPSHPRGQTSRPQGVAPPGGVSRGPRRGASPGMAQRAGRDQRRHRWRPSRGIGSCRLDHPGAIACGPVARAETARSQGLPQCASPAGDRRVRPRRDRDRRRTGPGHPPGRTGRRLNKKIEAGRSASQTSDHPGYSNRP